MSKIAQIIAWARTFPVTAPIIAAVDTVAATVTGNWRYVAAEPLVALGAIGSVVSAVAVPADSRWYVYAASYLTAVSRWFTEPRVDTR